VSAWIDGRRATRIDHRDRGLQYGDGLFETMRIRRRAIRLLDLHLDRLYAGCRRLAIAGPPRPALRKELERFAAAPARGETDGILKLILTRGVGRRGYRPAGDERATRIVTRQALPADGTGPGHGARVRLCRTSLGTNPSLAGLKSLNRLESVLARSEWRDERIWEGLMCDSDQHVVCGTMSNLFLRRGTVLSTPLLDRCGVAGVMRRWVMDMAGRLGLRVEESRLARRDLEAAEEMFMTNAVVGVRSIGMVAEGRLRLASFESVRAAEHFNALLELE
jgi:4-amino-4-deoxychorismate lyase